MKIKLQTNHSAHATKELYALAIKEQIGIDLHTPKIAPNPGKKAMSKHCLDIPLDTWRQRKNLAKPEYVIHVKKVV